MKQYLIAGNWKMNTTPGSARSLVASLSNIQGLNENVGMLVCPPFTNLSAVSEVINNSMISLGAQNCHPEPEGAFTGEVSVAMLKEAGCKYVIIGHSERRTLFGESDEFICMKAKSIIREKLIPIVCIGETLEERQSGTTFDVLKLQLDNCLNEIDSVDFVIAYEPVWAIGTGIAAEVSQVDEAHSWIADYLESKYPGKSSEIKILYGGSMKPSNAEELLSLKHVSGGLIGGASLKPDSFIEIYNSAVRALGN